MKLRARVGSMRRLTTGIVALAGLLTGCGVGNDATPRDIGPNEQAFTLVPTSVTSPTESIPTTGQRVYLFGLDGLFAASARGEDLSRDDLIRSLLGPATKLDNDRGLKSYIPIGTTLDHTTLANGILTLYLVQPSGTSFEGADAPRAFGQLVYTATDRPDVTGVLFDVNDQLLHPFDASGRRLSGVAKRGDYALFAPVSLGPDVKTPGSVATTTTATPITNPPTTTSTTSATTAAPAATTGS